MLKDVITEHLRGITKMVVIDYHTGLGDCGAAEMITEDMPGSPAYARQKTIWGEAHQIERGGRIRLRRRSPAPSTRRWRNG